MKRTLGLVMVGIYLLAGVFLLVKGWYLLSPFQNNGIGILLIVYAAFRAFRVFHESKSDKEEADESPDQPIIP